ncbi:hypothetical protein V8G54_013533 [Vigna mungo]|uniref:Uncharacterized protein n=1 Tax=Vigna mungo TaxID=3915 RepID=A0AAQ3NWA0_VIGMU
MFFVVYSDPCDASIPFMFCFPISLFWVQKQFQSYNGISEYASQINIPELWLSIFIDQMMIVSQYIYIYIYIYMYLVYINVSGHTNSDENYLYVVDTVTKSAVQFF